MSYQLQAGSLEGLYAHMSEFAGARRELNLEGIVMAEDAFGLVPAAATEGFAVSQVVIVQDETDIRRAGASVKPQMEQLFAAAGHPPKVVRLSDPHELHTTPEHIAVVQQVLRPGTVVVALGSGTVTDIAKHAVFEFEKATPGERLRLVATQTANSVVAYTSNQAPITFGQVKRTLPSRLPDLLVLDTQTLADCPLEYTVGGLGDAFVVAGSFADYRLANLLGMGRWEPVSWETMRFSLARFLAKDPILADRGVAGAGVLALDLAACGLSLSFAGESAPVSGLEHVTSHTLDMAAHRFGRPVGNHGSQCGLATILTLIVFDRLFAEADFSRLDPADIDDDAEQAKVRHAFERLDADGKAWRECWSD
ncbi:MAG: iron-containing alcohol dehydrogenase, partial [Propionibacteriaceae bacterium]|nr:iron-containing alcohol dehydrogenase [Propionibacteriaceae bacterium]